LDFDELQGTATTGGTQITWYGCTKTIALSACIPVTINNGQYLLLRWYESNDANNDHHMGIDDLEVSFDLTGTGCTTILPIELIDFTAQYNMNKVNLNWVTNTELNSDLFIVERSTDAINFEEICRVKGAGKSLQKKSYSSVDPQPKNGLSYYRLKQVDFDDAYSYSNIESVFIGRDEGIKLFPNPTETGKLKISTGTNISTHIELSDALGQVIYDAESTESLIELDLESFGKGIYVISIRSGKNIITKKVIYN
jgi:hypothetical protein